MARGVEIQLSIDNADGLREGTPIRFKGLDIGKIESVELNPDLSGLKGYAAARNIMRHLGWDAASGQEANASPVWTSHEMLLLDYELSMLREDEQRRV